MAVLTYPSYSKLNLYLDVGERRPDGFHDVLTVIEPLRLSDRLTLDQTGRGTQVISNHPGVPSGRENIVHRAAELMRSETGGKRGLSIRIKKNIPVAAGLGGGSANAAATLIQLNRLWGTGIPAARLRQLAAGLGSDVPFFLQPRTAICRGRGEIIDFLPPAPAFWAVLINPGISLPTGRAYADLDEEPDRSSPPPEGLLRAIENYDLAEIGRNLFNVFEESVSRRVPEVKRLLQFLRSDEVAGAVLAGSGPTVAAIADCREKARTVAGRARRNFPPEFRIIVTRNLPPVGP